MSYELPQEFKHLVFVAALSGRTFSKSELGVKLSVREIDRAIEETGLLDVARKGNSRKFSANDASRRWAANNLHIELAGKNKAVLAIFTLIQAKAAALLKSNRVSFAEFVGDGALGGPSDPGIDSVPEPVVPPHDDDPAAVVRRAYLAVSGGVYDARIRLKDLRKRLDLDRATQDAVFDQMIRSGEADFYPEDDPMSRDDEDERAALVLADRRRHIVYLHRDVRT